MSKTTKPQKKKRSFYMTMHRLLAGFFRWALRVHITGVENLPAEGGGVVCINHIAFWDVITVACVLPRQLRFLAKKELFKIPLLSGLITALGAYGIDRRGADVGAIKKSIAMAEGGELVAIFPQGTRHGGENPADTEVKNGAGMIIYRSHVSAIPVCIKMKKNKYALFRRIDVIVGSPIEYNELGFENGGSDEYKAATRKIFDRVCELGGFLPSVQEGGAE